MCCHTLQTARIQATLRRHRSPVSCVRWLTQAEPGAEAVHALASGACDGSIVVCTCVNVFLLLCQCIFWLRPRNGWDAHRVSSSSAGMGVARRCAARGALGGHCRTNGMKRNLSSCFIAVLLYFNPIKTPTNMSAGVHHYWKSTIMML